MTSVLRSISHGRKVATYRSPHPHLSFGLRRLQYQSACCRRAYLPLTLSYVSHTLNSLFTQHIALWNCTCKHTVLACSPSQLRVIKVPKYRTSHVSLKNVHHVRNKRRDDCDWWTVMRRKMVVCHSSTLELFKGTSYAKNSVVILLQRSVNCSNLHVKT
jgi:hypothetical protein